MSDPAADTAGQNGTAPGETAPPPSTPSQSTPANLFSPANIPPSGTGTLSQPAHQATNAIPQDKAALVAALQKLRTQTQVLKKAYIGEQRKNGSLQSQLREKEQVLRSSVEENDMLSFNNQRLTKRVEDMRDQIEEVKSTSGGWSFFGAGSKAQIKDLEDSLGVAKEQLEVKIKENEQLHMNIFDLKSEHGQVIKLLETRISEARSDLDAKSEALLDTRNDHENIVTAMNQDMRQLNDSIAELEADLLATQERMREQEEAMTNVNNTLSQDLADCRALLARKVPFDDTLHPEFCKLNTPSFDREFVLKQLEISDEALRLLRQLVNIYGVHYTARVDRLQHMNKSTSITNKLRIINEKIISLLPLHQKVFEKVFDAFSALAQRQRGDLLDFNKNTDQMARKDRNNLAATFQKYVTFHKKLLPYELLRLSEENRQSTVSPELARRNTALITSHQKMLAALDKLSTYIRLGFPVFGRGPKPSRSNMPFIARLGLQSLFSVHQTLTAFSNHTTSKISLEHKAPFILPAFKSVNERMVSSLSTVVASIGKLTEALTRFQDLLHSPPRYATRGAILGPQIFNHDTDVMYRRGRQYFDRLCKTKLPPRVPYALAVQSAHSLSTLDASDKTLVDQARVRNELNQEKQRFAQEREKWQREMQEQREKYETKISQLGKKFDRDAREQESTSRSVADKTRALENEKKDLERELARVKDENATLRKTAMSVPAVVSGPTGDLMEDFNSIPSTAPLDAKISELEGKVSAIEKDKAGAEKALESVKTAHTTLQNEYHDERKSWNAEKGRLQSELEAARSELAEARAMLMQQALAPVQDLTSAADTAGDDEPTASEADDTNASGGNDTATQSSGAAGDAGGDGGDDGRDGAAGTSSADTDAVKALQDSATESGNAVVHVTQPDGTVTDSITQSEDDRSREDKTKQFYEGKIEQLQTQLKTADDRAVEIQTEYEKLHAELRALRENGGGGDGSGGDGEGASTNTVLPPGAKTAAEVEATIANYEKQMKVLSEHVAGITEELTTSKGALEKIKKHRVYCARCKIFNNVGWLLREGQNGKKCSKGNHASGYNYI